MSVSLSRHEDFLALPAYSEIMLTSASNRLAAYQFGCDCAT
jgi:hypothetical protein